MSTMNHSLLNTGKSIFVENTGPGQWDLAAIYPNMQYVELFWLTTYCPTVIIQEVFEQFTTPYVGQNHMEQEMIGAIMGDWDNNHIFAPTEPGGRVPLQPARGSTLTNGVEVYGFWQIQLLNHPEFTLGGAPIIPLYLALIQGDGAEVRTTPATVYTDANGVTNICAGVVIPEGAYTQEMADHDNWLGPVGFTGGTEILMGRVVGLYYLYGKT